MEGKEGQECFNRALPPKAASTVNKALLQLICEGPSSLKTNPAPLLSSCAPESAPLSLSLTDKLYAVAFPSTLG